VGIKNKDSEDTHHLPVSKCFLEKVSEIYETYHASEHIKITLKRVLRRVSISRVRGGSAAVAFQALIYQCVTESWVSVLLHVWLKS
jgi:hypothetical protein